MGIFKDLGKIIAAPIKAAKDVAEGIIEKVTEDEE